MFEPSLCSASHFIHSTESTHHLRALFSIMENKRKRRKLLHTDSYLQLWAYYVVCKLLSFPLSLTISHSVPFLFPTFARSLHVSLIRSNYRLESNMTNISLNRPSMRVKNISQLSGYIYIVPSMNNCSIVIIIKLEFLKFYIFLGLFIRVRTENLTKFRN